MYRDGENKKMGGSKLLVCRKVENVKELFIKIKGGQKVDSKDMLDLKKRKMIAQQTWNCTSLRKVPNYAPERINDKGSNILLKIHMMHFS